MSSSRLIDARARAQSDEHVELRRVHGAGRYRRLSSRRTLLAENRSCSGKAAKVSELASGAHATTVSVLILSLGLTVVRLVGTAVGEDSFPFADGGHLPADRMFLAALTSRSWMSPHLLHTQILTASMRRS